MTIRILPNENHAPAGKVADAEVIFGADAGPLAGLRLIGFAVWQRRSGSGHNVTFPARTYAVNGERRSFALLRPNPGAEIGNDTDAIRDAIIQAYAEFEAAAAVPKSA